MLIRIYLDSYTGLVGFNNTIYSITGHNLAPLRYVTLRYAVKICTKTIKRLMLRKVQRDQRLISSD